eukprot:TRINITY_DN62415_c0_g1_i1.p1 TRINITY_DN62415_c0_g1~~TRINITY_DN62415_c0_g1_i1.p1  ORF type:complete len:1318 (-),score=128.83 TRINITY_DN62415_c0_g1_i1:203-3616(-)
MKPIPRGGASRIMTSFWSTFMKTGWHVVRQCSDSTLLWALTIYARGSELIAMPALPPITLSVSAPEQYQSILDFTAVTGARAERIFPAFLQLCFDGIPRCEGVSSLFSGTWFLATVMLLIRWVNFDHFTWLTSSRQTVSTTRPMCQACVYIFLLAVLQQSTLQIMQWTMLPVTGATGSFDPGNMLAITWVCPYSNTFLSDLAGRLMLWISVFGGGALLILSVSGTMMGLKRFTVDTRWHLDAHLPRRIPSGEFVEDSLRNVLNVVGIIPTWFGIWADSLNVDGMLIQERANYYATQLDNPQWCDECQMHHVPYYEVMKATAIQLSLASQMVPYGLLIGKFCEYANDPPLIYCGSKLKCLKVKKRTRIVLARLIHIAEAILDPSKSDPDIDVGDDMADVKHASTFLMTMGRILRLLAWLVDCGLPGMLRTCSIATFCVLIACTLADGFDRVAADFSGDAVAQDLAAARLTDNEQWLEDLQILARSYAFNVLFVLAVLRASTEKIIPTLLDMILETAVNRLDAAFTSKMGKTLPTTALDEFNLPPAGKEHHWPLAGGVIMGLTHGMIIASTLKKIVGLHWTLASLAGSFHGLATVTITGWLIMCCSYRESPSSSSNAVWGPLGYICLFLWDVLISGAVGLIATQGDGLGALAFYGSLAGCSALIGTGMMYPFLGSLFWTTDRSMKRSVAPLLHRPHMLSTAVAQVAAQSTATVIVELLTGYVRETSLVTLSLLPSLVFGLLLVFAVDTYIERQSVQWASIFFMSVTFIAGTFGFLVEGLGIGALLGLLVGAWLEHRFVETIIRRIKWLDGEADRATEWQEDAASEFQSVAESQLQFPTSQKKVPDEPVPGELLPVPPIDEAAVTDTDDPKNKQTLANLRASTINTDSIGNSRAGSKTSLTSKFPTSPSPAKRQQLLSKTTKALSQPKPAKRSVTQHKSGTIRPGSTAFSGEEPTGKWQQGDGVAITCVSVNKEIPAERRPPTSSRNAPFAPPAPEDLPPSLLLEVEGGGFADTYPFPDQYAVQSLCSSSSFSGHPALRRSASATGLQQSADSSTNPQHSTGGWVSTLRPSSAGPAVSREKRHTLHRKLNDPAVANDKAQRAIDISRNLRAGEATRPAPPKGGPPELLVDTLERGTFFGH